MVRIFFKKDLLKTGWQKLNQFLSIEFFFSFQTLAEKGVLGLNRGFGFKNISLEEIQA